MQRQKTPRFQGKLEERLTTHFEETMAELKELGSTEALLLLAQRLRAYTIRGRCKEVLFALAVSMFVALRFLDKVGTPVLLGSLALLVGLFYGPTRVGLDHRLDITRAVLLKASIELLESLTRTQLPALLTLLQALEAERPDSSDAERLVYHGALRLLSKNLPITPQDELGQLPMSSRKFLVRELRRVTYYACYSDAYLVSELPVCLFLALAELKQPGAESIAELIVAIPDNEERQREAAQEYLHAMRREVKALGD